MIDGLTEREIYRHRQRNSWKWVVGALLVGIVCGILNYAYIL